MTYAVLLGCLIGLVVAHYGITVDGQRAFTYIKLRLSQ